MFSLFSFLTTLLFLFSSLMVLFTTNPVYGIFFLILSFTLVSSFFILLGIDLLGLFIIILYVGAIAVLFLFVLMMLNVKTFEYYSSGFEYFYIYFCLGLYSILDWVALTSMQSNVWGTPFGSLFDSFDFNLGYTPKAGQGQLLYLFGEVFFTVYFVHFLVLGLLLLMTMIGAIVLTLSHKLNTKRQIVFIQVNRDLTKTVRLR